MDERNKRDVNFRSEVLQDADFSGQDLHEAIFTDSVMTGANFSGADLQKAHLYDANFRHANLKGADLRKAKFYFTDFSYADLTGANLSDTDIHGIEWSGAILKDVNFGKVKIPVVVGLHTRVLLAIQQPGNELNMTAWHTCDSTHCRGGWAIHLAGNNGRDLEELHGPQTAAALIYAAAYPDQPVPDFYAATTEAMENIVLCAEQEKAGV